MIKLAKADNTLFEGMDLTGVTPEQIQNSKKLYNYIVESFEVAEAEGKPVDDVMDEGIFGAIVGGAIGSTAGTALVKAICKVLGIDENGTLGKVICSRLVIGALGAQIGYNL